MHIDKTVIDLGTAPQRFRLQLGDAATGNTYATFDADAILVVALQDDPAEPKTAMYLGANDPERIARAALAALAAACRHLRPVQQMELIDKAQATIMEVLREASPNCEEIAACLEHMMKRMGERSTRATPRIHPGF